MSNKFIAHVTWKSFVDFSRVSNLITVKPVKGLQPYREFILQGCHIALPGSCFSHYAELRDPIK